MASQSLPGDALRWRGGSLLPRARTRIVRIARERPEIAVLVALAAVLNLWSLGRNGWANTYYSGAIRSMSTSWHDFLYVSLDKAGVMSVDKPPLSLWVQALSVRVFGFHPLAVLIPQALMGIVAVVLVYDLVARRFGRLGGVIGALALATTPIAVAMARHNNPDQLLTLCCVAAVWCLVRGLEDGRTRWLLASGLFVGLGFETKMGEALLVVPPIVAAWLWVAPAGRRVAIRQLLAGGGVMTLVGGAWPLLVALTPAADRPWISGTSDNSILSLIFGYNGLGRVSGQAGGPTSFGAGSTTFGGSPGLTRLLNSALGGQAGWLVGVAVVGLITLLVASRGRRADPRSGWLIAVGGSFLLIAGVFSAASGIFHPYYVELIAPFTAALAGAAVGALSRRELDVRVVGSMLIAAGVATELVVLGNFSGQLTWLRPLLVIVGGLAVIALLSGAHDRRVRLAALIAGSGVLLVAPASWAFDTLGYKTQSTFPAGGPSTISSVGFGGFGGFGGGGRGGFARRGRGSAPVFGPTSPGGAPPGGARGSFGGGSAPAPGSTSAGGGPPGGARGGFGGGFGGATLPSAVLAYVAAHGGGTIAVSSQSTAASEILAGATNVAGIGGFSGSESDPSIAWLAMEVRDGKIRWVDASGATTTGGRSGATVALGAAKKACTAVTVSGSTIYDCAGKGKALQALA